MQLFVSTSSELDGFKFPDGWLWQGITDTAAVFKTTVIISSGSATVPFSPPVEAK
jgi:hypothetical protein